MKEFYLSRSPRDKWLIRLAGKWVLLFLGITLYTLIIARGAYAKAERLYEGGKLEWQVEYAEGYAKHMAAVEENMPQAVDPEQMQRIEMMQEYWRTRK